MKEFLQCLVRWACRTGTSDFGPALAAPIGPVQIISFFPSPIQFICSHRPAKLGRQSCWVTYLLVCVSGFHRDCVLEHSVSITILGINCVEVCVAGMFVQLLLKRY
jgi:hypothetical protein